MKLNTAKQNLVTELKSLVAEERRLTTKILHLLHEVDALMIFAELGYSSLFDFTVRELGYSADAAFRRISAMRLLKALPEAESKLESGTLSLTAAAELQKFFRAEEKSSRLISSTPAEAPSTLGAKILAKDSTQTHSHSAKLQILESISGKSTREVTRVLFSAASAPAQKLMIGSKEKVVSENLTQITITIDQNTHQNIKKLMALLSNKNKSGDLTGLLEILVEESLDRHDPERIELRKIKKTMTARLFEEEINPKSDLEIEQSSTSTAKQSRYISTVTKREVYLRDQGKCQHPGCGSSHYLQFDHVKPYSWGGPNRTENLQLLCATHNQIKGANIT